MDYPKYSFESLPSYPALLNLLSITLAGGMWFGLPDLHVHARIAFITLALAIIGWCFTKINQTYVALAAATLVPLRALSSLSNS